METSKNKIKNEDELLGLFTDYDGIHPSTKVPFFHPTYNEVWATDGYVVIRISPERLNGHYAPLKGWTRLKLPKVQNPCQLSCTLDAIKQALYAGPLVDEVLTEEYEVKCDECDGDGEVEWEYTDKGFHTHYRTFDCPKCEGNGVIRREKEIHTGKKVHDEEAIVKIGNAFSFWKYLDIVAKALEHIGADVISVTANSPEGMTEFVFDGIKIGLMGVKMTATRLFFAEVNQVKK